ncbi:hypothetical protein [Idiomarina sp.]|nr:hypothetical protein [Idiomarina sp.]|tara:strand:- start:250 stop:393 length:144 start_codon:yes stop_codon:yes gene_type:complete
MKVVPALLFVAVGVWLSFVYPEAAAKAFEYIQFGINWVKNFFSNLQT